MSSIPFSAARPPLAPRRNYTKAAGKSQSSSNRPTPITLTSSGSSAPVVPTPTTVIPDNLEPSQNTLPKDHAFTLNPPQTPSHAATFSPQSQQKARSTSQGLAKPDGGKINVHKNAGIQRSGEPEKTMLVDLGPERSVHEGLVVMSGNGKDERLIQAVTADQAVPEKGKKKKRIVKKIVKVVKKVIVKRRVPKTKRVLMSCSENQELVAEKPGPGTLQLNQEINKSSNLANEADLGSGSQAVDEVMENLNPVGDLVAEKSNLVDGVVEKPELDKAARVLEPVACEKGIDASGTKSLKLDSNTPAIETVQSSSNVGARAVPQSDNTGNGERLESDGGNPNQGLLSGGEMEAMEGRKRRDFEIFVGGLDKGTNEFDIRGVFEKAGKVIEVRLATSNKTGKEKCFAFVRFATAAGANNALENYSKVEICGKRCVATIAKTYRWSNKQANNFTNHASKQLSEEYPQDNMKLNEQRRSLFGSGQSQANFGTTSSTTDRFVHSFGQRASSSNYIPPPQNMVGFADNMKLNEPRRNLVGRGQGQANFDAISFTTDRFVHSFGQRAASSNHIPPPQNMGPSILDHRFPLPGTKRPFPFVGNDPCYAEPKMLPPWRFGSSHPIPGPSVAPSPNNHQHRPGAGFVAPFPNNHQHRPSAEFTQGPINGWNMYQGHFQRNEQDPRYESHLSYPRN